MLYEDDDLTQSQNSSTASNKPNAYRVDEDDNTEETQPDSQANPVREGQPMGGQNFGEKNVTPSGNDANNPQQNAGTSNAYLSRNEPAEEHTESNNFKPGEDYNYNEGTTDNDKPTR